MITNLNLFFSFLEIILWLHIILGVTISRDPLLQKAIIKAQRLAYPLRTKQCYFFIIENGDDLSDDEFNEKKEDDEAVMSDDSLDGGTVGVHDQCPICLMSLKGQLLGTPDSCQHVFCLECIREWSNVSGVLF